MSQREIVDYFTNHPGATCGRFRKDQLGKHKIDESVNIRTGFPLLKAGIASLLLIVASKPVAAETPTTQSCTIAEWAPREERIPRRVFTSHAISGTVHDEEGNPLPGVSIVLKGTKVGTVSDLNGKFLFPQELQAGDILLFMFIGYETKEFKIPKHENQVIEVSMTLDVCVLMGEVAVNSVYDEDSSIFRKIFQKFKAIL
jgi:hypothetical protein